jgi:hypothetical protein
MPHTKSFESTDLTKEQLIKLIGMYLGEVLAHYGMWFAETSRRIGVNDALEMDSNNISKFFPSIGARLYPLFGIPVKDGLPVALLNMSREELLICIGEIAKTWLTGDGLWFQEVERSKGMAEAKLINDSCWSLFAKMEAHKIKRFLDLPGANGLDVLEAALKLRIYSVINAHSLKRDDNGDLIFTMTECRVQSARRRKDLDHYPCKSAGLVEYSDFAHAIDPRIKVECVWCPPDRVPETEFCSWRFSI